jgi:hypothetical protein
MGLAIFSSQNINLVTVRLASLESIKVPIGLLLIFCAGIGAILTTIFMTSLSPMSLSSLPWQDSKFAKSDRQTSPKPRNPQKEVKSNPNNSKKRYKNDFDDDWEEDWG